MNANVKILLLQGSVMAMDRYAAAESFYKLGMAFAPVPDLHIMWLLHLCDAHQEMQSWAEAAQCAVAVAGVIMQVIALRCSSKSSLQFVSHSSVHSTKYYLNLYTFLGLGG